MRLLLIDDYNVSFLARLFSMNGMSCLTANNGEEGLEAFEANANDISLVITDYLMPGINGGEVLTRIKRHSPKTPVIIVSATSDNIPTEILELADGVFGKPFSFDKLKDRVSTLNGASTLTC